MNDIFIPTSEAFRLCLEYWPITLSLFTWCCWSLHILRNYGGVKSKPLVRLGCWFILTWLALTILPMIFKYDSGSSEAENVEQSLLIYTTIASVLTLAGLGLVLWAKGRRMALLGLYLSGFWFLFWIFGHGLFEVDPIFK